MMNRKSLVAVIAGLVGLLTGCVAPSQETAQGSNVVVPERQGRSDGLWTDSFMTETCTFSPTGSNPYFILQPGYQLVFDGKDKKDIIHLIITVLDETKDFADIKTRVVEERETKNGKLAEISRNYFAICERTNSVFYFGEDADFYDGNGNIVNHDGSWQHGVNGARFGLQMPGIILLGARSYQEIAPGVALDRAEILSMTQIIQTPAGKFENALQIEETTLLKKRDIAEKFYASGIGLIKAVDKKEVLELTEFGFVKK